MWSLLSSLTLAQFTPAPITTVAPPQRVIVEPQDIRTLPGRLDEIPVFNSNSPEVVYSAGILLSTFPPDGKAFPRAHLNHPMRGRFDVFSHHIARGRTANDWLPIYHGVLVHNPTRQPALINILQGLSYVTNPDAPFVDLPPQIENPRGNVFSGPGSRLAGDVLRGLRDPSFPLFIEIPPGESRMLYSLPIQLGNARSTLVRVRSNVPVYMASLALPAVQTGQRAHREPTLQEWEALLQRGYLAYPRDLAPTPLDYRGDRVIYGRVSGVAKGSQWRTEIVDPSNRTLSIPQPGQAFSYPISTVNAGTLGTGQIQSAPMLVRYPDTAYLAHGNYGVHYYLTLPLQNRTNRTQRVHISLHTPVKHDEAVEQLEFLDPPDHNIFFRGPVQVRFPDERGILRQRLVHLVQRRGQKADPLVTLDIPPNAVRQVKIDFVYPPDATPPQVITVETEG